MKALSILSCVIFVISIFIIGCGEERNLPTADDQQALMAPKNPKGGNSYGQNRILALNTSSGEIVCVPEIAVEKSPVLIKLPEPKNCGDFSDVDVGIIVRGTAGKIEKRDLFLFYGQLKPGDTSELFYESFTAKLSEELGDYKPSFHNRRVFDHIGSWNIELIKVTVKDVYLNEALFNKIDTILCGMMTAVDKYAIGI